MKSSAIVIVYFEDFYLAVSNAAHRRLDRLSNIDYAPRLILLKPPMGGDKMFDELIVLSKGMLYEHRRQHFKLKLRLPINCQSRWWQVKMREFTVGNPLKDLPGIPSGELQKFPSEIK